MQNQIAVIDTKPYLYRKLQERDNRLEDIYWPRDNHFTELGYRYFAAAVGIRLKPKFARSQTGLSASTD